MKSLHVIACNDGGIAEVIHSADVDAPALDTTQPNGLLVPPRDIPAAARALEFLILNPKLRKQIGEAARKKIEAELTWDAVAQKYIGIFERK